MLRRILLVAVIAGAVAGLVATLVQGVRLWPLIAAAERFEEAGAAAHQHGDAAAAHQHDHEWQPADGAERVAYTVLFNILAGFGFALLLNGALVLRQAMLRGAAPDMATGAMWGLAGFACFALAPAFGLPPELPGMEAADLLDRQLWWVATAAASAAGLALLVFARSAPRKALGLLVLIVPHLVGAPHTHETGNVPAELAAQFVGASLVAAAVFWVVLGAVSGWLHRRLA
jgi:cobalt transporter subunit CbtA